MDNDHIEIDCRHWDEPERWEPEWIPADPILSDTEWNALRPVFTQPHAEAFYMSVGHDGQPRFCNCPEPIPERKEPPMLIKIRQEGKDRKAPLAYRRDEKEYRLIMQAYHERIEGKEGAQERWNAVSAGSCQGLTVEESLRRFGRLPELS